MWQLSKAMGCCRRRFASKRFAPACLTECGVWVSLTHGPASGTKDWQALEQMAADAQDGPVGKVCGHLAACGTSWVDCTRPWLRGALFSWCCVLHLASSRMCALI